jgi:hypothetical protein
MPRKYQGYEPDAIDCNALSTSLGEDFGVIAELATRYERDQVVVICTTRKIAEAPTGAVQVQALVRAPLRSAKSLFTMQYSALLDCWHQLDRGALAVASRPIVRRWDGRPEQPRRRT